MTPRKYELYLQGRQKLAVGIPTVVFFVMPLILWVMFLTLPKGGANGGPVWLPVLLFFVVMWGIGGLFLYTVVHIPIRMTVTARDQLEFASLRATRRVAAADVVLIEPASLRFMRVPVGTYRLVHRAGDIRFVAQFDNWHVFLSELKQANPRVVLRGC